MASSKRKANKIGSICFGESTKIISNNPDTIVREFLYKLIEQFTIEATRRMSITEHTSSVLHKEQINIILTQALAKITNTFLMKPQFGGRHNPIPKMAYSGLDPEVDFWVMYEGTIFLVSFTNEIASLSTSRLGKKLQNNWNDLITKLGSVQYTGTLLDKNDFRIYRIALDVVTMYKTVKSMEAEIPESYNLSNMKSRLLKGLDPKPNWSACWKLSPGLIGPYKYTDTLEGYPTIVFLAHFSEVQDERKIYKGERHDCLTVIKNKKQRRFVAGDWIYFAYQKATIERPNITTDW